MADISKLNIGGSDYNIKDATARTSIDNSLGIVAYKETGNTASQAYSVVGTPINWKGTLYYTKTAVAKGATWTVGTNLTAATNLGKLVSNIKTYVNGSGELVFRDLTGADTVLPFSGSSATVGTATVNSSSTTKVTLGFKPKYLMIINENATGKFYAVVYNEDITTDHCYIGAYSGSSSIAIRQTIGSNAFISSIDNDGFTVSKFSSSNISAYGANFEYVAVP